eukprot:tig00020553_g10614.t1
MASAPRPASPRAHLQNRTCFAGAVAVPIRRTLSFNVGGRGPLKLCTVRRERASIQPQRSFRVVASDGGDRSERPSTPRFFGVFGGGPRNSKPASPAQPPPTRLPAEPHVCLPLLVLAAQVGTLARVFLGEALAAMGVSLGASGVVHSALLANIVGCAIFGMSQAFSGWSGLALVLLRSWFCGSLTSFSNWIQDVNLKILRGAVGPAAVTLVVGLSVCYSSLLAGEQIGRWLYPPAPRLDPPPPPPQQGTLSRPPPSNEPSTLSGSFPLAPLSAAAAAGLSALLLALAFFDPPRRRRWLAALCGPFGCAVRYELSRRNNRTPTFPLMTFAANVAGSLIVAACFVVLGEAGGDSSGRPRDFADWRGAALWMAVIPDGFCGCLSTFSSFVGEVKSLEAGPAWRYALASVLAALLGVLAVCGLYLLAARRSVGSVLGAG